MKTTFTLSAEQFALLKAVDFSEMENSISFDDERHKVSTDDLWLLQTILTEEINTKGLTPDQENVTDHGRKLEALYDEILYLTSQ